MTAPQRKKYKKLNKYFPRHISLSVLLLIHFFGWLVYSSFFSWLSSLSDWPFCVSPPASATLLSQWQISFFSTVLCLTAALFLGWPVYMERQTFLFLDTHIHTYVNAYFWSTRNHTHAHTYAHVHVHTHTHTHMHAHTHTRKKHRAKAVCSVKLLQEWLWQWITQEGWYAIKKRNQRSLL